MKSEIAKVPAHLLATVILAEEAGKVLAYAKEAGKWVRRSSFPELSARAVFHAVPGLDTVYDTSSRELIRRALIYASRRSVFAAVRLPVDLSDAARALRQWTELLMVCPHELHAVAQEVELVGIVTEAHRGWIRLFYESIVTNAQEVVSGILATQDNVLFCPREDGSFPYATNHPAPDRRENG